MADVRLRVILGVEENWSVHSYNAETNLIRIARCGSPASERHNGELGLRDNGVCERLEQVIMTSRLEKIEAPAIPPVPQTPMQNRWASHRQGIINLPCWATSGYLKAQCMYSGMCPDLR
jgi:hypothetical protein